MTDQAKGASRVGAVQTRLSTLGFRTARISASGQRRGARRTERGLDADVIALAPENSGWPHLLLEVGGLKKSAVQSFREMTEHGPLPPGFVGVVVRYVGGSGRAAKWRWHLSSLESHPSLDALLAQVGVRPEDGEPAQDEREALFTLLLDVYVPSICAAYVEAAVALGIVAPVEQIESAMTFGSASAVRRGAGDAAFNALIEVNEFRGTDYIMRECVSQFFRNVEQREAAPTLSPGEDARDCGRADRSGLPGATDGRLGRIRRIDAFLASDDMRRASASIGSGPFDAGTMLAALAIKAWNDGWFSHDDALREAKPGEDESPRSEPSSPTLSDAQTALIEEARRYRRRPTR